MWNQAILPTWPSWVLLKLCQVNVLITFYPNHDNKVYTGRPIFSFGMDHLPWFLAAWKSRFFWFPITFRFPITFAFLASFIFTIQNPDSQMFTVKTGCMRSVSKWLIGVRAKVSIVNRFSFLNGYTDLIKFPQNPWESAGNFHEI